MNKIIAKNVKKIREISGCTQEEMARVLGVTRSAYSNYESGEREMPYDIMEKASDFFGCDMELFFEDSENINARILVSAFRIEGLKPEDMAEIMCFKDIVKSYLKMEAIEAK